MGSCVLSNYIIGIEFRNWHEFNNYIRFLFSFEVHVISTSNCLNVNRDLPTTCFSPNMPQVSKLTLSRRDSRKLKSAKITKTHETVACTWSLKTSFRKFPFVVYRLATICASWVLSNACVALLYCIYFMHIANTRSGQYCR